MHSNACIATVIHIFIVWSIFVTRTTYDNIDGPGRTIYVIILGPAGPLMYSDQIFRYKPPGFFVLFFIKLNIIINLLAVHELSYISSLCCSSQLNDKAITCKKLAVFMLAYIPVYVPCMSLYVCVCLYVVTWQK